jgi:hypothetical protein
MPIDKRTFIINNSHRDETSDINNDLIVTLPDGIFSGNIESISLRYMTIDYGVESIGSSNREFYITYPSTSTPILITLDIDKQDSIIIKTDQELASLISASINSTLGTTVFQTYFERITTAGSDVYRDNSDMLGRYTIFTNDRTEFIISFDTRRSLGPLIGFGNETYSGNSSYDGGTIAPIANYESIHISNKAYDPIFREYDANTDIACKMDLYDPDNNLILNSTDTRDTTISIPIVDGYITSIHEFVDILTTELNSYSSSFDNKQFKVVFDFSTGKFTISIDNTTQFGIGFRFNRENGSNNYGSLHRQLGFEKQIYLGLTTISSILKPRIFDNAYQPDVLFVCSDLIAENYDSSLIVAESNGKASMYECLFSIPTDLIETGRYFPNDINEHKVRIHASLLAKLYNENLSNPKKINFWLKLASGRHIKMNSQWMMKIEIEYVV